MPVEIKDKSAFKEIASRAVECRVKKDRKSGMVKIKARTKRYLYTIKLPEDEAKKFLEEIKCQKVVNID